MAIELYSWTTAAGVGKPPLEHILPGQVRVGTDDVTHDVIEKWRHVLRDKITYPKAVLGQTGIFQMLFKQLWVHHRRQKRFTRFP